MLCLGAFLWIYEIVFVLCVGEFCLGLVELVCAVCGSVCCGFGGVCLCCVCESLGVACLGEKVCAVCRKVWCGFGGVSVCCVWKSLVCVWGSEFCCFWESFVCVLVS